jgi:hypothetical protein
LSVKGGLMLVLATGIVGWICGCTQSASTPAPSSVSRGRSVAVPASSPDQTATPTLLTQSALPLANQIPGQDIVRVATRNAANPWKPATKSRGWKHIVLHHTAADRGSLESIHEAHLRRRDSNGNPWLGIGYHFVIGNGRGMKDGAIEPSFRWRQQLHGAHAGKVDYNQSGIGICLVGNFEKYAPTKAQLNSVRRLIGHLQSTYKIHAKNVIGHGDLKQTACPGRHFSIAKVKVTQGSSVPRFGDFRSQATTRVILAAQEQYPQ